jgi:hypothetical protein
MDEINLKPIAEVSHRELLNQCYHEDLRLYVRLRPFKANLRLNNNQTCPKYSGASRECSGDYVLLNKVVAGKLFRFPEDDVEVGSYQVEEIPFDGLGWYVYVLEVPQTIMRIPTPTGRRLRCHPATHYDLNRPPITTPTGHPVGR